MNRIKTTFLLLMVFLGLFFLIACDSNFIEKSKLDLIEDILIDFQNTHSYTSEDGFVCIDMAISVWNELETQNITSRIVFGNVEENLSLDNLNNRLSEINHAWVLAEYDTDKWIALETTGGFLVTEQDNELYYKGYIFDNARLGKEFNTKRIETGLIGEELRFLINDRSIFQESLNNISSVYNNLHLEIINLKLNLSYFEENNKNIDEGIENLNFELSKFEDLKFEYLEDNVIFNDNLITLNDDLDDLEEDLEKIIFDWFTLKDEELKEAIVQKQKEIDNVEEDIENNREEIEYLNSKINSYDYKISTSKSNKGSFEETIEITELKIQDFSDDLNGLETKRDKIQALFDNKVEEISDKWDELNLIYEDLDSNEFINGN